MLNLETSGTRNCACVRIQDRFQLGRHVHCCRMSRNERVNGFNLETKSFCEEQPQNFNGLHNCSANFFRVFQGCMMVYVSTSPSTTFRPSFIPLIPRHCCTVCPPHWRRPLRKFFDPPWPRVLKQAELGLSENGVYLLDPQTSAVFM